MTLDQLLSRYTTVWCWDTEFVPVPGWRITPVCVAATEMKSGATHELWLDHAGQRTANPLPFPTREDAQFEADRFATPAPADSPGDKEENTAMSEANSNAAAGSTAVRNESSFRQACRLMLTAATVWWSIR